MIIALFIVGWIVILGTALPFINHPVWWIRIFDFPRIHIATLGLVVLVVYLVFVRQFSAGLIVWLGLLGLAISIQFYQIFPHTPFAKVQTLSSTDSDRNRSVRVLIANVLQSNRQVERFLAIIAEQNPDIILAVETDQWWARQLQSLTSQYPIKVEQPQDNTYGLVLYSRLPLFNTRVRTLVSKAIPSVFAQVKLPSGAVVDFYGLHPEPPHPIDNESTEERDAELILVAKEVRRHDRPAIVAGDLNDVAWSHTTRLFQRISQMLDPRIGRGLYNTFPATLPLLRFPLDHVFHSKEFKLAEIQRLEKFGSDHFPILIDLVYDPQGQELNEPPEGPDREDIEEADDKIQSTR